MPRHLYYGPRKAKDVLFGKQIDKSDIIINGRPGSQIESTVRNMNVVCACAQSRNKLVAASLQALRNAVALLAAALDLLHDAFEVARRVVLDRDTALAAPVLNADFRSKMRA